MESSLEEYASHLMHADMVFLVDMERQSRDRDVFEAENMAVVSTRVSPTMLPPTMVAAPTSEITAPKPAMTAASMGRGAYAGAADSSRMRLSLG